MADPNKNIQDLVSGAYSMIATASTLASASLGAVPASSSTAVGGQRPSIQQTSETSPEDIPKEELMHLCMKMNKRMQAMEAKGQELVKKKNSLVQDKQILIDFLKSIPLAIEIEVDKDPIDPLKISNAWHVRENSQTTYISNLESKLALAEQRLAEACDKPSAGFIGGAEGEVANDAQKMIADLQTKARKADNEIDKLKHTENVLRENISSLEAKLATKGGQIDELQRAVDQSKAQAEEQIVYLQMQLQSLKTKDDKESVTLKKSLDASAALVATLQRQIEEKDMSAATNREVIQALQVKLMELEPELERSKEKVRNMERISGASTLLKAEQEALSSSLRKDLRTATEAKDEAFKRIKELEEFRMKAEGQLLRLGSLTEQVNILQTQLEDKSSLITRLRSEAQTNERNHAMRTAMLATCEAQLEVLQAEMKVKDETAKEAIDRVTMLQTRLTASEQRLAERVQEMQATIAGLEEAKAEQTKSHEEVIASLKSRHESDVETLKKDFAKKSNLARTLLSEKEEEVRILSAKIQELQAEIASGAPSERKIFEFAAAQAKRDIASGLYSDTREFAFQQLQSTLAKRDLDLASVQQHQNELMRELMELRRTARRETVNMDYLKNVVLQYMTFPISSPERMSLVPVISMLLQFNPKEVIEVDKATKDPNWSMRPVKEIKRSLQTASLASLPASNNSNLGSSLDISGASSMNISPTNSHGYNLGSFMSLSVASMSSDETELKLTSISQAV